MELSMGVIVKQYPYRTARVAQIFITIYRDEARMFEQDLAEASNSKVDNHTVYELTNKDDGATIYVWCTDNNMFIGSKLDEGN